MSAYLQPSRIHDLDLIGKKLLCVECKTRTSAKKGLIAPMCERIIHQECWAKQSTQCDQCALTISEPSIAARRLATGRANRPPVQLLASSSDSSSSELDASMGGPGGNGRGQSRGRSRPRPHQANSQARHRTESLAHRQGHENPSGGASSSSLPAPSRDLRQRKSYKSEDRDFQRAGQVALVPGTSRSDPHLSETEQQLYVGMARSIVYYSTLGVAYNPFCLAVGSGIRPRQEPGPLYSRGDLHLVRKDVQEALKELRLPERGAGLDPCPRPDPPDGAIRRQPWKKQLLGGEGPLESRTVNIAI
jgi:hypothetical protein